MKLLIIIEGLNNSSSGIGNEILADNLLTIFPESKVIYGTGRAEKGKKFIKAKRPIHVYKGLAKIQEVITKITGWRLFLLVEQNLGFSFNFFYDVFCLKQAMKFEDSKQYNYLITLSQGASFRPHYMILKYFPDWHGKWIANFHDPFPFHQYPRPYNYVRHNYEDQEKLMKGIASKAAVASFPSGELAKWMSSYNKFQQILIIPHQMNQNPTNSENVTIELEYLKFVKTNIFNIIHVGTLLPQRYITKLLVEFIQFAKTHTDVMLSFIGPIDDNHLHELENAKTLSNGRIDYLNERIHKEQSRLLHNNATVNLVLEANNEISPFLPGKFPHCLQANRPIFSLSPFYSEMKNLLGKDYKYLKQADDSEGIKIALSDLYNHWKSNTSGDITKNYHKLNHYFSLIYLKEEFNKLSEAYC